MTSTPTSEKITVVDLFAGCGGLTKGFHDHIPAGATESPFRTVGAVEFDKAAAATYAANFPSPSGGSDHVFPKDIADWAPGDLGGDVDVILGGPPCQGFSALNRNRADDPRNRLWREYITVVGKLNPKLFVIENVDRFLRSPEYGELKAATEPGGELEDYRLEQSHLVAADFGVPQARKRTIVLATHRDLPARHPEGRALQHPRPTHSKVGGDPLWGDEAPWTDIRSVFGTPERPRTPLEPDTTELPERHTQHFDRQFPGTFRTSELHIGRTPTRRSKARYEAIPPGGNRHDLPPDLSTDSWMRHKNGSGDVMGRLHLDRPSVTIRTEFYKPEKGRYLHPWAHRPITHYEAALIQGFPQDYLWCGSKIEIARQIGNAVPVGLARAIAAQVHEYLSLTRSP